MRSTTSASSGAEVVESAGARREVRVSRMRRTQEVAQSLQATEPGLGTLAEALQMSARQDYELAAVASNSISDAVRFLTAVVSRSYYSVKTELALELAGVRGSGR